MSRFSTGRGGLPRPSVGKTLNIDSELYVLHKVKTVLDF